MITSMPRFLAGVITSNRRGDALMPRKPTRFKQSLDIEEVLKSEVDEDLYILQADIGQFYKKLLDVVEEVEAVRLHLHKLRVKVASGLK
jgi:hypothetical protein